MPVLDYKFVALGHTPFGRAGAAILNAELMHREGSCEILAGQVLQWVGGSAGRAVGWVFPTRPTAHQTTRPTDGEITS